MHAVYPDSPLIRDEWLGLAYSNSDPNPRPDGCVPTAIRVRCEGYTAAAVRALAWIEECEP